MKIAIFLPRYHTNYIGVVQSLRNKKHQVKLYVHNKGYIENYSVIKPIHIEENTLTKIINYFIIRADSKISETPPFDQTRDTPHDIRRLFLRKL